MDNFNITFHGFKELLDKFNEFPDELMEEADAEIEEGARDFVRLAKIAAPGDTGRLRGSINYKPLGFAAYAAFAQTSYAAYQEWGTIEFVSVPADLVDIAIKYKGMGIRKTGGVTPKHYFYSQEAIVVPKMLERIDNVLEDLLNK